MKDRVVEPQSSDADGFAIVDLETTGLRPTDSILQMAVILQNFDGTVTDQTSDVGSAMRLALDTALKRDISNKDTLENSNMARALALVKKIPLTLPHDILADPSAGQATIPAVRPIL